MLKTWKNNRKLIIFNYLKKPPRTLHATFLATHSTGTALAIYREYFKVNMDLHCK